MPVRNDCPTFWKLFHCELNIQLTNVHLPPLRIGDGVAKHVEEEALGELIVFVDEGLGLFPHPIRLVQNPRNPLLLLQWWQWD